MSEYTIHHVTAVTAQIRENRRFYTELLGLRLVKRSVNQDDVTAYHLFYADAAGSPGTDMTFFDWPTISSNVPGAGTIAGTTFVAPAGSLDWWQQRLENAGLVVERGEDEEDRDRLLFGDSEGQRLELVDGKGIPTVSVPWTKHVPEEHALRGILGVDLESARPDGTFEVLTKVLGYEVAHRSQPILERRGETSRAKIRLQEPTTRRVGRVGAGGVHHVAFRVDGVDTLVDKQRELEALGIATSGLVDRYYFQSLYFREPGGILFELATDGPGFASDEGPEHLGETLALPPFLEPRRAEIEAGLKPID